MSLKAKLVFAIIVTVCVCASSVIVVWIQSMGAAQQQFTDAVIEGRVLLWQRVLIDNRQHLASVMRAILSHKKLVAGVHNENISSLHKVGSAFFQIMKKQKLLDNMVIFNEKEKILFSAQHHGMGAYRKIAQATLQKKTPIFNIETLDAKPKVFYSHLMPDNSGVCIITAPLAAIIPGLDKTSTSFIINVAGTAFYSNEQALAELITQHMYMGQKAQTFKTLHIGSDIFATSLLPLTNFNNNIIGYLVNAKHYTKQAQQSQKLALQSYFILALCVTMCGIGFFLFVHYLLRPLDNIAQALMNLAKGKIDNITQISGFSRSDEIGLIARTVELSYDNLQKLRKLETHREKLYQQQNEKINMRIKELSNNLDAETNNTAQQIILYAQGTLDHSNNMSNSSDQLLNKTTQMLDYTEKTDIQVQALQLATNELNRSLDDIDTKVKQVTTVTQEAVTLTTKNKHAFEMLSTNADRINQVLNLISDIAERAHLLALNAGIESSNTSGKNFSKVAVEVKNLANQITKEIDSVSDITLGIQNSTKDITSFAKLVIEITQQMDAIAIAFAQSVDEKNIAVNSVMTTTQEVTNMSAQIKQLMNDVFKEMGDNANEANNVNTMVNKITTKLTSLQQRLTNLLTH